MKEIFKPAASIVGSERETSEQFPLVRAVRIIGQQTRYANTADAAKHQEQERQKDV